MNSTRLWGDSRDMIMGQADKYKHNIQRMKKYMIFCQKEIGRQMSQRLTGDMTTYFGWVVRKTSLRRWYLSYDLKVEP